MSARLRRLGAAAAFVVATGSGAAEPVAVLVELAAEPAAVVYARQAGTSPGVARARAAEQAAAEQVRAIENAQRTLVQGLEALGGRVLFGVQRVLAGVAVLVDRSELGRVAGLPGVAGVRALEALEPALASTVPFVGAPTLWSLPGGVTGRGVRIGFVLWIVGWAAFHGAAASLLLGLLVIASVARWRGVEEASLEATWGDAYRRYRDSTWF